MESAWFNAYIYVWLTLMFSKVCSMMFARTMNLIFFFFNDTATTEIYTLSLHDALPILLDHRDACVAREGEESFVVDRHLAWPHPLNVDGIQKDAGRGEAGIHVFQITKEARVGLGSVGKIGGPPHWRRAKKRRPGHVDTVHKAGVEASTEQDNVLLSFQNGHAIGQFGKRADLVLDQIVEGLHRGPACGLVHHRRHHCRLGRYPLPALEILVDGLRVCGAGREGQGQRISGTGPTETSQRAMYELTITCKRGAEVKAMVRGVGRHGENITRQSAVEILLGRRPRANQRIRRGEKEIEGQQIEPPLARIARGRGGHPAGGQGVEVMRR